MQISNLLLGPIVGFPLLSALYLLAFKPGSGRPWTALALLGAGLASLARYISSGQAACTLLSGPEGCLQGGVLALSVILLNGVCLAISLERKANQPCDYEFYGLLNAAWGAAALIDNWVISLAALSLGLIAAGRWVRARGGSVGYFASRDDYRDDIGPPP